MINYSLSTSFRLFIHSWPTLLFCFLVSPAISALFLYTFWLHGKVQCSFIPSNAFSKLTSGKKAIPLIQIYFVSWLVQFPSGYILPFLMFGPPVKRMGTVLTFHNVFKSPSVSVISSLLKVSQDMSHDIKIIVIMPAGWQAWVYEADLLLMGRVVAHFAQCFPYLQVYLLIEIINLQR